MNPKILITGSSSLVGSHFVQGYGNKYDISAIGRTNIFRDTIGLKSFHRVDLTDSKAIESSIKESDADVIINFAAETRVDECERAKGRFDQSAYIVNTQVPRLVSQLCKETGRVFFQISTDAVFDGSKGPYYEEQETGPLGNGDLSWYGFTKFLAEREILNSSCKYCIVRISHPYRACFERKIDFARKILRSYRNGTLQALFVDQIFSPTLIDDLSAAINFLLVNQKQGIYHVASRDITSPFEFGRELLAEVYRSEITFGLRRGSVVEFNKIPGKAPRLVKGGLRTDKISREKFTPRTFHEGIIEFHKQLLKCN